MQSFSFGGYDPKIFVKPVNQDFNCPICSCNHNSIYIFSRGEKTSRMYRMWYAML